MAIKYRRVEPYGFHLRESIVVTLPGEPFPTSPSGNEEWESDARQLNDGDAVWLSIRDVRYNFVFAHWSGSLHKFRVCVPGIKNYDLPHGYYMPRTALARPEVEFEYLSPLHGEFFWTRIKPTATVRDC